ncbi:MAG: serine hydrolase [Catenulispora sp.]|nr:serine hydrolase [Catenulispora sp.]
MTRLTSRRSLLGMLGATTIAGGAAGIASVPAYASPDQAAASVDAGRLREYCEFVQQRAAQDQFSGNVMLARRGKPVLVRSYGMADKARSAANTADTVFWLASITKCFTALAIAQLAEQGSLAFTDTLGTYLPGFSDDAAAATIQQLLTHTSGVGRPALGPGNPDELKWNSFDEVMDGTLDAARKAPLQCTPGSRFVYSNDGFFVLAAIVAKVTGQSYFDYVRERVFGPADMHATDFYSRPQVQADERIARPYFTQPDGSRADLMSSPYTPFSAGPAGGAYTTASDLLSFATNLTDGSLISPAFAALLTGGKVAVPPAQPPSQAEFYAFGHLEAAVNGQRVLGNKGGGPGVATRLDIFPAGGWVSIVLSNYDTTIDPIVQAARQLVNAEPGTS